LDINKNETVYMIRHAEAHPTTWFEDGNYVAAGEWRALGLPNALRGKIHPTQVYSIDPAVGFASGAGRSNSSYVRPSLTAERSKRKLYARKSGDCRIHFFEIHEIDRVLESAQLLAEFRAEPRFPRLHARSRTPLALVELEIIWNVPNALDAHFRQLLNGAGLDSRQVPYVVIWTRRIALVEEFTPDRVTHC
jgi:hypothetical protein